MPEDIKRRAILYLGLAMLLTILIAASLSRARFMPGLPMPVTDGQSVAVALPEPAMARDRAKAVEREGTDHRNCSRGDRNCGAQPTAWHAARGKAVRKTQRG